jgi:multidrug resistance protein MdtO
MSVPTARSSGQGIAFSLIEFLRRELAPTPGRFGATLRLTLACTAATVPIMIYHIPAGLVVMVVMYMVAKEDTTATLLGSVVGLVAVTVGLAVALIALKILLATPWRLAFVFLFAALGLYLGRSMVLGAVGSAIGIPTIMAMVFPDLMPVPNTEAMTEYMLWIWWCIALGLAINLGVQLLLSPGDSLVLFRGALVERLRAVERAAQSLGGQVARATRPPPPSLNSLAVAGASDMLTLLKMASLRHAWARQRHAELAALVTLIDQLVTAAAALEATHPPLEGDAHARLERVASMCDATARALSDPSAPWPDEPSASDSLLPARSVAVPALTAMERVLGEIAVVMSHGTPPGSDQPAPETAKRASLFLPDAFSNPDYLRLAIRGGLACLICDVFLVGFAYPGIYTSVITCFVVSLSTVGASTQKGVLRFTGAAVGGEMGILALIYVLPHVTTLGGFWAVFATGTAAAAWVNFGSSRVSYGGYQIGMAFYKVVLQGWGPVTQLVVARDRLIGIAFGLVVYGILEHYLWPVRASDRRRQRLADVLRSLAGLASLGARERTGVWMDRELDGMRRGIAQGLAEAQHLLEESKFELRAGEVEAFQRSIGDTHTIYLVLLSLAYQRRASGTLLADLPAAVANLDDAVARNLESLADMIQAGGEHPTVDLAAALAAAEGALASLSQRAPDDEVAVAVRRRLELYRTLVRLVAHLHPWGGDASSVANIASTDRALTDVTPRP